MYSIKKKVISGILSFCLLATSICLFKGKTVKAEESEKLTSPVVSAEISNIKVVVPDDMNIHPNTQTSFQDLAVTASAQLVNLLFEQEPATDVYYTTATISKYFPELTITFDAKVTCKNGDIKNISVCQSPCISGTSCKCCQYKVDNGKDTTYIADSNNYCTNLLFDSSSNAALFKTKLTHDNTPNLTVLSNPTELFSTGDNIYYLIKDTDSNITYTDSILDKETFTASDNTTHQRIFLPVNFTTYDATLKNTALDVRLAPGTKSRDACGVFEIFNGGHLRSYVTKTLNITDKQTGAINPDVTFYTECVNPTDMDYTPMLGINDTESEISQETTCLYKGMSTKVVAPVKPNDTILDSISAYISPGSAESPESTMDVDFIKRHLSYYCTFRYKIGNVEAGEDSLGYKRYQAIAEADTYGRFKITTADEDGKRLSSCIFANGKYYDTESDVEINYVPSEVKAFCSMLQLFYYTNPVYFPSVTKNIFTLDDIRAKAVDKNTFTTSLSGLDANYRVHIQDLADGTQSLYAVLNPCVTVPSSLQSSYYPEAGYNVIIKPGNVITNEIDFGYKQCTNVAFVPIQIGDPSFKYSSTKFNNIACAYNRSQDLPYGTTYFDLIADLQTDITFTESRATGEIDTFIDSSFNRGQGLKITKNNTIIFDSTISSSESSDFYAFERERNFIQPYRFHPVIFATDIPNNNSTFDYSNPDIHKYFMLDYDSVIPTNIHTIYSVICSDTTNDNLFPNVQSRTLTFYDSEDEDIDDPNDMGAQRLYFVPFTVNIVPTEISSAPDSITAKYTGSSLKPGQSLSKSDISVVLNTKHTYDDGTIKITEAPVTDFTFQDTPLKVGDNKIDVFYNGFTTSFIVTVPSEYIPAPDTKTPVPGIATKPVIKEPDNNDVVWHFVESQPDHFDKHGYVDPVDTKLTPVIDGNPGVGLKLNYDGKLPENTKITVNLTNTDFTPGDTVYFYYYNEDTKQIELVDKSTTELGFSDGNYSFLKAATFNIHHCSYYIITNHEITEITPTQSLTDSAVTPMKSPKTGVGRNCIPIGILLVISGGLLELLKKRKVFI